MTQTRITWMEAIATRRIVVTQYNGAPVRLAPHLLFERHGDLYVQALNLSKAWRPDEDRRLGQFKLAGLATPELLDEAFEPLPAFDAAPPRPDDTPLLAI